MIYRRLQERVPPDSGLSLLEVIVAIAIMTIVATASATLALTGIAAASTQERRQVAVTIASSTLEIVGAQTVAINSATGVSNLFTGRTSTAVASAWSANSSGPGVGTTYAASDPTATTSSVASLPITSSATQVGTAYSVTTLLGTCYEPIAGGDCARVSGYPTTPPATVPTGYTDLIRAIVIVSWTAGKKCSSGCTYTASTLIDPSADLVWVNHG